MDSRKTALAYGILLICVGAGVFYRIPEVVKQVETIAFFARKITVVKGCFYFIGIALITAGIIRVNQFFKKGD